MVPEAEGKYLRKAKLGSGPTLTGEAVFNFWITEFCCLGWS